MTNKAGLYVHIPFCVSRCDYCSFVSCTETYKAQSYVNALTNEINNRVHGEIDTVFIGGGTPSVLPRGQISKIFSAINKNAVLSQDCEITVEANPDSCSREFLEEIISCGVNRLSLGVQSLNDNVLKGIGRRHTSKQALAAIKRVTESGINNINCDIIIGLPGSTLKETVACVKTLAACGATHISAYALGVEEGTTLYKSGYKLDEDYAADTYCAVYDTLSKLGFTRYEVSNFCRDGKICRHNFKYWDRAPYIGVGAAAHSFIDGKRIVNTSDISSYINGKLDQTVTKLNRRDELEEYIMLGLRTYKGISFKIADSIKEGWSNSKRAEIELLCDGGFLQYTKEGVRLNDSAYYVMNEVIVRLI